jgi:hypothetical protein
MPTQTYSNFFLASLPQSVRALVSPDLEPISFDYGTTLDVAGHASHQLIFPETGIIALSAGDNSARTAVGVI